MARRHHAAARACLGILGSALAAACAAEPVLNPDNGHYYDSVDFAGTWAGAMLDAQARSHLGLRGHLATLTSAAEDDFVVAAFGLSALAGRWLGGYQDIPAPDYSEPAGAWRWVTGEFWGYNHWLPGEPNDANGPGTENNLQIRADIPPYWNDTPNDAAELPGYVIEYESRASQVGGVGQGLRTRHVQCRNPTTGQTVSAKVSTPNWNCEALGLVVSPLDIVVMDVRGSVD
jgi:hypothetical protein